MVAAAGLRVCELWPVLPGPTGSNLGGPCTCIRYVLRSLPKPHRPDILSQFVIFGLEFEDLYSDPSVKSGAAAVRILSLKPTGVVLLVLSIVAAVLCISAWVLTKRIAARKARVIKDKDFRRSMKTMDRVAETLTSSLQREQTRASTAILPRVGTKLERGGNRRCCRVSVRCDWIRL